MKKLSCLKIIPIFGLFFSFFIANAQYTIREDDHFFRRRVVNRISLDEKINRPLVHHESSYYGEGGEFPEKDGLIVSLINGLKQGKYLAHDPEDWSKTMSYQELEDRMEEFDIALRGEDNWGDEGIPYDEVEDDFLNSNERWSGEEWPLEDEYGMSVQQETQESVQEPFVVDYEPYEQVVHMVEDWIFDKGRSEMKQSIAFFEIIWVDPTGVLPEKVLARFDWKDVEDQLDQTQWKNRFNDGHTRSMKDIFVMRMFNGYMINVGGEPVVDLMEAERRRQKMVEFEHNLWSY